MEQDRKKVRALLGIVAFGVALFVGLWHLGEVMGTLRVLLGMVSFFFVGLSVAFILAVPLRFIETRLFAPLNKRFDGGKVWPKLKRPLSVVLTVLLVLMIINLVVFMVIPSMARTVEMLTAELPGFWEETRVWITDIVDRFGGIPQEIEPEPIDWAKLGQTIMDILQNGVLGLITGTVSAATSVVSGVVNFVVGFILAIYILLSKERLAGQVKRVMYAYLPEKRVQSILEVGVTANRVFSNFLSGQFLESVILGLLFFIGMTIFGFPFAPMVSVLVGVMAIIPIFGAFIGAFVGTFMILVHQGLVRALWFVVFFLVVQQIEGNLIYPHVVGKSVMLPGLWVLAAVTLGGNVAGILGMLVSVPLCALLYTLLRKAVDRRNAEKGISI